MDLIERLLRQKYLLADEELFELTASDMRYLLGTDIMLEIADRTDELIK
jgi:hypothetical protein